MSIHNVDDDIIDGQTLDEGNIDVSSLVVTKQLPKVQPKFQNIF